MRKISNSQRGDTIMEVLICVAMLGFMLGAAFSLTNRNQLSSRASQERSEATRLAEKQVEYLRTYYARNSTGTIALDDHFCFDNNGVYTPNVGITNQPNADIANDTDDKYDTKCKDSTNGYSYKVSVWKADTNDAKNILGSKGGAHVVTVRWDNIKGGQQEEVKMFYSIDQLSGGQYNENPGIGGGGGFIVPECRNGIDDDGDGRIDFGGPTGDPDCSSAADTSETGPIPATISQSSYSFPSWHLLNSGGARPTRVFTITNPSTVADIRITTAIISGANTNSFSVISNGCLNRTLAPLATCNITVQFYPPSTGSNNRLSNAGNKTATLTVNNSNGVASVAATLSGKAYSDQLGPGDVLTGSTQGYFHTYNVSCYNNVEACGSPFTGIAGNGNLYLGGTYCAWGGWGPGGYGNYFGDANKFIMQTDGNLVLYDPYTYRYASWTQGNSDLWLRTQDSGGGVYISSGSGGGVFKWIHYGGSCFAW